MKEETKVCNSNFIRPREIWKIKDNSTKDHNSTFSRQRYEIAMTMNICDNGHCVDFRMIDLARKLDKADREALSRAAMHLTKMEQYPFAAEVYSKMGDIRALINLHVEAKHWEDVRL